MWSGFRVHKSMGTSSSLVVLLILAFLLMNLIFQMTRFGQGCDKSSQKVKAI